ncbi:MAG: MBL fold metallo-hydrolase [Mucilaginibacter sp.]|uniref:MBL fold metallo-hydrolase n=1 Tax=Mucilaginibacter sp. TaxID=1882438 RepID=UPI0031AA3B6B
MNRLVDSKYFQVTQRVWGTRLLFVNIYMIANRPGSAKGWVLVDTGLKGSSAKIIAMAEALFGPGTKPSAIVLTHGHADHAGSLPELLMHWNLPVYAHRLEVPYLTGLSSYPPTDPFVGGGLMSLASVFFPVKPLHIRHKIKAINVEEGIPELPEWEVIETPGHSPGHISLYLPGTSVLLAGDALATTQAESAISVYNYTPKLSGPPKYFTTNWVAAAASVRKIAAANPRTTAPGHGHVMRGREMQDALQELADNFEEMAVPSSGRYVDNPATANETGVTYVPPFVSSTGFKVALSFAAALAGFMIMRQLR